MKALIIALVAVIVIGAGASAYLVLGSDDKDNAKTNTNSTTSDQATNSTNSNEETEETASVNSISANDLLQDGKDVECTFSFEDGDDAGTGTGYFAGGTRMRMDFTSTTAGETYDGGMIISSSKQIVWDNKKKQGFAMDLADDTDATDDATAQGFDTSKKFEYDCKSWTVDETKFTAPAGIAITDLNLTNIPGMP